MFEEAIEKLNKSMINNIKLGNYDTARKISEAIKNLSEAENALSYLKTYGSKMGGAV